MLKERTRNGKEAARQQGRIGGRRSKLKADQKKEILKMVKKDKMTAASAA